jgi:hypothetical protein
MKKILFAVLFLSCVSTYKLLNTNVDCFCDACVVSNYEAGDGIEYATEGK